MDRQIMCTECDKTETMTAEMEQKMCQCDHKMEAHRMGAEHMQCMTCGSADNCGNCPCGHALSSHKES